MLTVCGFVVFQKCSVCDVAEIADQAYQGCLKRVMSRREFAKSVMSECSKECNKWTVKGSDGERRERHKRVERGHGGSI